MWLVLDPCVRELMIAPLAYALETMDRLSRPRAAPHGIPGMYAVGNGNMSDGRGWECWGSGSKLT